MTKETRKDHRRYLIDAFKHYNEAIKLLQKAKTVSNDDEQFRMIMHEFNNVLSKAEISVELSKLDFD